MQRKRLPRNGTMSARDIAYSPKTRDATSAKAGAIVDRWRDPLKWDPMPFLLGSEFAAVRYFARRDLSGEDAGPIDAIWRLPEARRILRKQLPDGSWPRAGAVSHPAINYGLIETWRRFRYLIQEFGFTREHPAAERAAEFLFSCQTRDGDFRGFLADQYATYYTGAIMALLVQAGYGDDPRMDSGFEWLLSMRQEDGGWTVPILTYKLDRATQYRLTSDHAQPLEPDRSKPFSHNCTGMAIRAFAAHPVRRRSDAALAAASLLKSRFFRQDSYTSYRSADYWVRFDYPFWWNDLVAAMDSLSSMGLSARDAQMKSALDWFVDNQEPDGSWRLSYAGPRAGESATAKSRETKAWVTLAICRIFMRLFGT